MNLPKAMKDKLSSQAQAHGYAVNSKEWKRYVFGAAMKQSGKPQQTSASKRITADGQSGIYSQRQAR